jgi:hypothetical protein
MLQNIVATALIGTEHQPFTPPTLDGKLGELISKIDPSDPEAALLSIAAAIFLHQKLGQKPLTTDIPAIATICPAVAIALRYIYD